MSSKWYWWHWMLWFSVRILTVDIGPKSDPAWR